MGAGLSLAPGARPSADLDGRDTELDARPVEIPKRKKRIDLDEQETEINRDTLAAVTAWIGRHAGQRGEEDTDALVDEPDDPVLFEESDTFVVKGDQEDQTSTLVVSQRPARSRPTLTPEVTQATPQRDLDAMETEWQAEPPPPPLEPVASARRGTRPEVTEPDPVIEREAFSTEIEVVEPSVELQSAEQTRELGGSFLQAPDPFDTPTHLTPDGSTDDPETHVDLAEAFAQLPESDGDPHTVHSEIPLYADTDAGAPRTEPSVRRVDGRGARRPAPDSPRRPRVRGLPSDRGAPSLGKRHSPPR